MLMSTPFRFASRTLLLMGGVSVLALMSGQHSRTSGNSVPTLSAAEVVELNKAAREYKLPDQIPWPAAREGAAQTVTLVGDPRQPGLYIQMLRRPPNNWSPPHKHDHTRYITVLKGTMWIGTGDSFDKDKTVGLTPGSFLIDYANQTHYDGSKDDGLTIEILGIVPPKQ
jgi:quercetin dioxygenase-like cupin family protein